MSEFTIKYVFGYYNRKSQCFENFAIFDSIEQLADYNKALFSLYQSKKYPDFEFANYILYPQDYSVFRFDSVHYVPVNPIHALIPDFKECGDFVDILGIKGVEEDVKGKESDIYDSEQVYSDSEPRT